MSKNAAPAVITKEEEVTEINFRFGEKSKIQPQGLGNLTANQPLTVKLEGKVTSFSAGDPWDKSKRFTLRLTSCDIVPTEATDGSLDAAIEAAKANMKKMEK